MSSLRALPLLVNNPLHSSSRSSFSFKRVNCSLNVPKLPRVSFSLPKASSRRSLVEDLDKFTTEKSPLGEKHHDLYNSTNSKAIIQLYAILEAVADRIEMHNNVGEQRVNWNTLLLNSINMLTLAASTMAGVAGSYDGAPVLALKLSLALLFSAAMGMLLATT